MSPPRSIPTRSGEMLDVERGENGETVVVTARDRRAKRREVAVVVEPAEARRLGRRLIAVADAVDDPEV